ncbi:MAG: 50S ribosomal protein L17 [Bacteroidales bacterium]|nr:50S ribosomal protein L17 [Bacteroidales bacterium]
MRHKKNFNHLGRKKEHREALLKNLAISLILHKRIKTTLQKAKALRSFVEPIITLTKEDSTHHRRMAFKYLQNKEAVKELFRVVAPKVMNRPGGYTRILKLGNRIGDNAELAMIELVDFNELIQASEGTQKSSTRRRRRKKSTQKETKITQQDAKQSNIEEKKSTSSENGEMKKTED